MGITMCVDDEDGGVPACGPPPSGGGVQLSELVRVAFKADSLARTAVVLVLDLSQVGRQGGGRPRGMEGGSLTALCCLSQPQNLMCGLLYWLRLLRSLTSERLEELRQQQGGGEQAEALLAAAKARYAKDHMDR